MINKLQQVVEQLANLPDDEQERLADWLSAELESDRRWNDAFANSQDALAKLADEALAEFHAGNTEELDIDKL